MTIYTDGNRSFPAYAVNPLLLTTSLYGLYTSLFIICLYFLVKSKKRQHIPFLLAVVIMFSLATTGLAVEVLELGNLESDRVLRFIGYHAYLYLAIDIVANGLLIYRLYMIWDRKVRVIVVPCASLITAVVTSIIFGNPVLGADVNIYIIGTMAVNALTSALLAGRIWWMARKLRQALGPMYARRHSTAFIIIVESGSISVVYMLLMMLVLDLFYIPSLIQVVGIVPTLVIVQVALGHEVRDLHTTIKSARYQGIGSDGSVADIAAAPAQHNPGSPPPERDIEATPLC